MRYSFVLDNGRMTVNGRAVASDRRLYHLDLPRAVALTTEVSGTVEGAEVQIPAVDVLGALRAVHGGTDSWLGSGARAQLTGATATPHNLQEGRAVMGYLTRLLDDGKLTSDLDPPTELPRPRRLRWEATTTAPDGKQVSKRFEHLDTARDWLRRRALAHAIGWPFTRIDQLLDDADTNPTLDEILDFADHVDEPPIALLTATGV